MTDPHEVLGLPADAGETDLRRRYLELVREFPPDRAAERFAQIRAAYEELRDPKRRLESRLFEPGRGDSLEALAAELRSRLIAGRMPVDALLSLADQP
jgi:curved DNA-binding protein CbpA